MRSLFLSAGVLFLGLLLPLNGSGFNDLKSESERGDASAQYSVGKIYYYGKGVTKDYSEAFKWFSKAAHQEDAKAQCMLGHMYYHGYGVIKDYGESVNWYRKAAEQGNANAQCSLGDMYYRGTGVTKDYTQANQWFLKAAEQKYAVAQYMMGHMYYYGRGVIKDYGEAVNWCRKAAEQGHANAQYMLGDMYYEGRGITKDFGEAINWYRKAAKQGHAKAQYSLGYMYYHGYSVTKNYCEAANWYRKAAEQGYANAQCSLGDMYYEGRGVTKDFGEAINWYRKAAEQGDADGRYSLGCMYYNGQGIIKDYAQANQWFHKSAEQGSWRAQNQLVGMYLFGFGVKRNLAEAAKWLDKAEKNPDAGEMDPVLHLLIKGDKASFKAFIKAHHHLFLYGMLALAVIFVGIAIPLIRVSRHCINSSPGLWVALGWLVLCFELQLLGPGIVIGLEGGITASRLIAAMIIPVTLLFALAVCGPNWKTFFGWPAGGFSKPELKRMTAFALGGTLVCYLGMWAYEALFFLITGSAEMPYQETLPFLNASLRSSTFVTGLCVSALAPTNEEILFRGFLYDAIRRYASPWMTIMITALCFSLIHGQWFHAPAIFFLGVVLGWAKHKTGSLFPAIAIHILNNSMALLFLKNL